MTAGALLKRPTAFLPIAMSVAALAVVLLRIMLVGTAPEPDEGTAAHLWQLLIAMQLPVIAWFAIKWLPREGSSAFTVLAAQATAGLLAVAPIWLLGW